VQSTLRRFDTFAACGLQKHFVTVTVSARTPPHCQRLTPITSTTCLLSTPMRLYASPALYYRRSAQHPFRAPPRHGCLLRFEHQ
jgi:hypothetical protein